ncbi:class I lanthipeptide [Dyadobacter flavalbus]|uniref:class I lanthipeptide n=1 Tax=Dyadobacter flavalbus TaxID=2579942 RepID=UPI001375CBDF|nr:class I lanthipeptide [Dyadobacter flavalbus]
MKKKTNTSRLCIDKETIARLNEEQLSIEQTKELNGGVTAFTVCGITRNGGYTACS